MAGELKKLKILLITPQGRKEEDSHHKPLFSMAIGTLVTITPTHHCIELADEIWGDLIDYEGDYDLVGITVRTLNALRAYDIADAFMARNTTVVLGGVHPSLNFDEARQHCSCVVCGEADNLWAALLEDVARGALKERYDAQDFPPVLHPPGLDYARIFAISKRDRVDVRKPIPVFLSRGCPYGCLFCCTPDVTGTQYRIQPAHAIQAQLEEATRVWFKKTLHGSKPWFQFCDENIAVNREKTWEALEAIKKCNIYFSTYCSINLLEDPGTVQLLVEAGCIMVLVGFESLKKSSQEYYGKEAVNKIDTFLHTIRQCRKAGLCVQGNFLINPQHDTYEDMREITKFIWESAVVMPTIALVTPFPGTRLYAVYKTQHMIVDEDWDKYTCQNLVVQVNAHDPHEYHKKFLECFLSLYSWPIIIKRVLSNRYKFLTWYTSIRFRKNMRDQLRSLRLGVWEHELPENVKRNMPKQVEAARNIHTVTADLDVFAPPAEQTN